MKITQVITRMDTLGGAQVHVRDLSNYLISNGNKVSIISGKSYSKNDDTGLTYIQCRSLKREINPYYDLLAIFEIRRELKEMKPDLVATHSSKAGFVGRIAAWSLRIPTIFTAHGWSFTEGGSTNKRKLYLAIEKAVGRITTQVITVSDYDRNLAIYNHVLPPNKIQTVHNGILPFRKVYELDKDKAPIVNILMVARFDIPKRQLSLVKACEKLTHLSWRLSFVGEGSKLVEVIQYVEENNLKNRVHFYGSMESIEEPLSQAHIFVLLSDYEGLPLSILEAMQAGLPIVASDVGGVKEAVMNLVNGFLIPKEDEDLLIFRLNQLIINSNLRLEMGIKGKELFQEKFTFDRMFMQTIEVYKKILKNH